MKGPGSWNQGPRGAGHNCPQARVAPKQAQASPSGTAAGRLQAPKKPAMPHSRTFWKGHKNGGTRVVGVVHEPEALLSLYGKYFGLSKPLEVSSMSPSSERLCCVHTDTRAGSRRKSRFLIRPSLHADEPCLHPQPLQNQPSEPHMLLLGRGDKMPRSCAGGCRTGPLRSLGLLSIVLCLRPLWSCIFAALQCFLNEKVLRKVSFLIRCANC